MQEATLRRAPPRSAAGTYLSSVPAVLLEAIRLAADVDASLNALSEAIGWAPALSCSALQLAAADSRRASVCMATASSSLSSVASVSTQSRP